MENKKTTTAKEENLCEALWYVLCKMENETTNIVCLRQLVDRAADSMMDDKKARAVVKLEKVSKELAKLSEEHREILYQINRLYERIYGNDLDDESLEG